MPSRAIAMVTGVAVFGATLVAVSLPRVLASSTSDPGSSPRAGSASGASSASGAALAAPTTEPAATTSTSAAAAAAAATKPFHPSRLTHLGDARQVVVVTATTWKTSYAKVRTYSKDSSGWHRQFKKKNGRLGTHGFAHFRKRYQDSGETPAGTYGLLRAFGAAPDPGTTLPYRQFDSNDWWPYDPRDPRTYNVEQFQGRSTATEWRKSWAEHLSHFQDQYEYAVVLDYNLPSGLYASGDQRFASDPADTARGGGIFFHINGPGATAGCVSVGRKAMLKILRWLDPSKHPVIVMAPTKAIGKA
jgi:L,D-peptidoglycan transpeptidase YkuD (ErfK/YbiS/YcfS/YnhG family)